MNKLWGHLKIITAYKLAVVKLYFRCGLHEQGFLYDLSKYVPIEPCAGVKYFQGNRSPIDYEKEAKSYSLGWLHHKSRNKHHWEYWLDNVANDVRPVKIPLHYTVEIYCNRTATSRIYMKENYHDGSACGYSMNGYDNVIIHEETKVVLKMILGYQRDHGTDTTVDFIRKEILEN